MSGTTTSRARNPFPPNWPARIGLALALAYLIYATSQLGISAERLGRGFGEGARFLARMFPPDFHRWELLLEGMLESLQIAVLSSALGLLLSLPLGLMAARNLSPGWLATPTRGFIAICRSLHFVIVAIIFVKALGFGALAGIAALTIASMGFTGKLFAEAIEEISMKQVEAVRALPHLEPILCLPELLLDY